MTSAGANRCRLPGYNPAMSSANPSRPVKTRFAPSPTGFLHIGGARTALFAWAYARHYGGQFVLRIEDSDQQRYSDDAVQGIIDGMNWLGLAPDDGPYYQSERIARYQEVVQQLLADGRAYHCYCSPEELDKLREGQRARGDKPRYDGRWRPEVAAAQGLVKPDGVAPVVRFRNPDDGVVHWDDMVKGPIAIANAELDDLIIARADGSPTYNFCVVVDDWDREITHVIRGDDHVNNTPRQINILAALGAPLPVYGHVPMIHGPDGKKLSKRRDAVSVMHYEQLGYLPEAVVNYLARLGWSHGDDELFSIEQFIDWFDGSHLSQSPSQFDTEKLNWVNAQFLKLADNHQLADQIRPRLEKLLHNSGLADPSVAGQLDLAGLVVLMKERVNTLEELATSMLMFYARPEPVSPDVQAELVKRVATGTADALASFSSQLTTIDWQPETINALVKETVAANGLKMPQFGVPLRVLVFGRAQTPALDQVLAQMPASVVADRLNAGLPALRALVA